MEKIEYFEKPTQVSFFDVEQGEWVGGIGYESVIICGDTGEIVCISDVYYFAPDMEDPIRPYEDWVDISDMLMGVDFEEEE